MVVVGLFHRPAAFIISGEMAVTYWWMHVAGRGLVIAAYGGGDFSIDGFLAKRRSRAA